MTNHFVFEIPYNCLNFLLNAPQFQQNQKITRKTSTSSLLIISYQNRYMTSNEHF